LVNFDTPPGSAVHTRRRFDIQASAPPAPTATHAEDEDSCIGVRCIVILISSIRFLFNFVALYGKV
jgi:hypothetical protein